MKSLTSKPHSAFVLSCIVLLLNSPTAWAATTYYVDGHDGNDSYDGLAPDSDGTQHGPRRTWKWFSSMDGGGLQPGDRVLLKRGTTISRGDATKIHEYTFGYFRNFQRMIRGDRWKLIQYPQIDHWQLFDLASDPDERHNLADEPKHAEIKHELQSLLRTWQHQVGDPLAADDIGTH